MSDDTRCPFDPTCKVSDPCPHPDACEWYVENEAGGHCAARDSDEVLLRYQVATGSTLPGSASS